MRALDALTPDRRPIRTKQEQLGAPMSPFDHGTLPQEERRRRLDGLRNRLAPYEAVVPEAQNRLRLGALDAVLPWNGLPCGALHQITGTGLGGAIAAGFAFALLSAATHARKSKTSRFSDSYAHDRIQNIRLKSDIVWISCRDDLFGPGVARFGIEPSRLLIVHAKSTEQVLWSIEESLRCPSLYAVIGETDGLDLTSSRRLQLAASQAPATALFVLGPAHPHAPTTAALTRWRIEPASAPDAFCHLDRSAAENRGPARLLGRRRWQVGLERCRGGRPGAWLMEWDDETHTLAMAAQPGR
ncbi:MAG: ImuA family protein [Alphaproteobacteria bacterium]